VPTKKRKAAHAGVVQENVVEIRVRNRDAIREAGSSSSKPKGYCACTFSSNSCRIAANPFGESILPARDAASRYWIARSSFACCNCHRIARIDQS